MATITPAILTITLPWCWGSDLSTDVPLLNGLRLQITPDVKVMFALD